MMTAQQIKDALKPMTDFAPAVLRAGEIVAAAEEAEKLLQEFVGKKSNLESNITALENSLPDYQRRADQSRQELGTALSDTLAAKTALEKVRQEIAGLQGELKAGREAIDAEVAKYKQAADFEIAAKTAEKQAKQKEIDDLQVAFEKWKRERGL